jgi:hypothetical protein
VQFWPPHTNGNREYTVYFGHWAYGPSAGDWKTGDFIVKPEDNCPSTPTSPSAQVFELETTYEGGKIANGNFFDIVVLNDIRLKGVKVNLEEGFTDANVAVFYHLGSYTGVMKSPESWTKPFEPITVDFSQSNVGTTITFPTPIVLSGGGTTYGFYITRIGDGELRFTEGSSEGALYVQDANVQIKVGRGVDYPFGFTYGPPYIWNGAIVYELA